MVRLVAVVACCILALGACTGSGEETDRDTSSGGGGSGAREGVPRITPDGSDEAKLVRLFRGLEKPLLVTAPPADPRIFVVEQGGTVFVAETLGKPLEQTPWLDLTSEVTQSGGEQGLLGMAFHPQFATNGRVYLDYTDREGTTKVVEITVDPAAGTAPAQPGRARTIVSIDQPYPNHNGGNLAFGPDGLLWIGTGDGGAADDPENRAQNPASLLGKMLRVDVNAPGAAPQQWALGLRNPWRYSFDADTGDLWIGDVGQGAAEEIDVIRQAAAKPPVLNFGWPAFEGDQPNKGERPAGDLVAPVAVYGHDGGNCSVTGGYVYRGPSLGGLDGRYVYGDYCTGRFWTLDAEAPAAPREITEQIGAPEMTISSFGEDAEKRLYVTDAAGGNVFVFTGDAGVPEV